MMAVRVTNEPDLKLAPPTPLFEGRYSPAVYDVAPDGRLLRIQPNEPEQATQIHVVLNWFTELQQRVPVK